MNECLTTFMWDYMASIIDLEDLQIAYRLPKIFKKKGFYSKYIKVSLFQLGQRIMNRTCV
jgi:hypothetical protein